jgi:hypothetical protein
MPAESLRDWKAARSRIEKAFEKLAGELGAELGEPETAFCRATTHYDKDVADDDLQTCELRYNADYSRSVGGIELNVEWYSRSETD